MAAVFNTTATQLQIMQQKIDDLMAKMGMQSQALQQSAYQQQYSSLQNQIAQQQALGQIYGGTTSIGGIPNYSELLKKKEPPKKLDKLTNMLGKIL